MLRHPRLFRSLLGAVFLALWAGLPQVSSGATQMLSIFPEDEAPASRSIDSAPAPHEVLQHRFIPAPSIEVFREDAWRLYRNPPRSLRHETDLGCIAVAVFHEARGEPYDGQLAVASVIIQRAITPGRWGDRPCDVVRPVQFSFMTSRYGFARIDQEDGWQAAWARAIDIAARSLSEGPMPRIQGADHYHAKEVAPEWRLHMARTAVIGNHYFYRDPDSYAAVSAEFQ